MLGSIKSDTPWVWGAKGKHPVAKDYIAIGDQTPLLMAFSDWMESGYAKTDHIDSALFSWRFWAKGVNKNDLVCGLIRDSHDSFGRPYPFLVMGTGPLPGWEDRWELLPYILENAWTRLEYFSTKKTTDYSALERELQWIPHPVLNEDKEIPSGLGSSAVDILQNILPSKELLIDITAPDSPDPADTIALWHRSLKTSSSRTPNAVFIGGTAQKTLLAVYERSLLAGDFIRLWSVDKTD
ncbi:MAG TPA: DUF2094 domain-containing protein [Deltaproteobacteria bacterium]|nr:DUF2094 domain-containing protein [Deltaproteobacteria bacterium]